jgi:hypothetical protein
MTVTRVVVEGNCSTGVNCVTIRDELMFCPGYDRDILKVRPEELFCLLDPDCPPRLVDLCEVCPRCCVRFEYDPWEDPWEILIGQTEEVMRLELLFKDKILGVSEPLDEPIRQDGRVYHQVMRLHELPDKDLQYGFKVLTGPRAEKDVQYRLNMDRMAPRRQLTTGKTAN